MYETRYWGIISAYTILHVQAGHVICLGISNKSVAVPDRTAFALHKRTASADTARDIWFHCINCHTDVEGSS